jgi:hypothetical protein
LKTLLIRFTYLPKLLRRSPSGADMLTTVEASNSGVSNGTIRGVGTYFSVRAGRKACQRRMQMDGRSAVRHADSQYYPRTLHWDKMALAETAAKPRDDRLGGMMQQHCGTGRMDSLGGEAEGRLLGVLRLRETNAAWKPRANEEAEDGSRVMYGRRAAACSARSEKAEAARARVE